jgi:type III secretion protein V
MERIANAMTQLARQKDVFLVTVFVLILLMMILPLPPFLMDVLITLNLSASILILLMSLQLKSPVHFSTFPSLLLVTTLFRLAISIATTRLILLEGHAGEIVETFGQVVVGGNLFVGLVIFLIITVVQFIVITKGADRVAEVGARFTLDGMPGKQMSVDADVRAGTMDQVDAKLARETLEREAKLFGAMDGAMKFVKGDAIAGLVITAINLLGGIAIGMMQFGYGFSEALNLYALMTIGDGLVAQIPALMISVSAGTIVTRVTNPQGTDLGTEISEQMSANHRTVIISGVVIALFGFVPGFPTVIFVMIGMSMVLSVLWGLRKAERSVQRGMRDWVEMQAMNDAICDDGERRTGVGPSVTLVLPRCFLQGDPRRFYKELTEVNASMTVEFGLSMGNWKFRFDETSETAYQIIIKDDIIQTGVVWPDYIFVKANMSYVESLDIPCVSHFGAKEGCLVDREHLERLIDEGISGWDHLDLMFMDIKRTLAQNLELLIGFQSTSTLLETIARSNPTLVESLREALTNNQISAVLKLFVQERMPITSKVRIFEAILEWAPKRPDPYEVLQQVRLAIGDFISKRFAPDGFLPAIVIAPTLEGYIRDGFRAADDQRFLILDSEISRNLATQVRDIARESFHRGKDPVLLAQQDVRRALFNVLHEHGIYMPVVAYQEILPETIIYPVGFITHDLPQARAA